MLNKGPGAGLLVIICLVLNTTAQASSIIWHSSRAQAVEAAKNSGKLILLLAGRDACGNCQYMKDTVCESDTVRSVLGANYVGWYCLVDSSSEWYSYAGDLGNFFLPLICVIDPGAPTGYLDRSTSIQYTSDFLNRLNAHLPSRTIAIAFTHTSHPRLRWISETGFQYRVQRSTDLAHWNFIGSTILGTGALSDYSDLSTADRCYYRIMGFK